MSSIKNKISSQVLDLSNVLTTSSSIQASQISGTVASATQATQDGSGNTISSTYYKSGSAITCSGITNTGTISSSGNIVSTGGNIVSSTGSVSCGGNIMSTGGSVTCIGLTSTGTNTIGTNTTTTSINGVTNLNGTTNLKYITESLVALSSDSIDLSLGTCFTKTISAATTFTISNSVSSKCQSFVLVLTNGGSYTITWGFNPRWSEGEPPDLVASGTDILSFMYNGIYWYGAHSVSNASAPSSNISSAS